MKKPLSEMTLEELWELFPIVLKEHDPRYFEWYESERRSILSALSPEDIARINHFGSSAVPGLTAKPTVDILLEMDGQCRVRQLTDTLKSAGWTLMSKKDEPFALTFNKGYTPDGFAERVFHLHVRYLGDWGELYFRDYLIAHPDTASEYGELKQNLLLKYRHDRDAYTGAKTAFVEKHTRAAKREFPDRYVLRRT